MARGDHIKAGRGLYTHHGVDLGDGKVAHYSGLCEGLRGGPVSITTREEFGRGRRIAGVAHARRLDPEVAVERALGRLGEDRYHLLFRNCEHFATWAVTGQRRSSQVRRYALALGTVSLAAVALVVAPRLPARSLS